MRALITEKLSRGDFCNRQQHHCISLLCVMRDRSQHRATPNTPRKTREKLTALKRLFHSRGHLAEKFAQREYFQNEVSQCGSQVLHCPTIQTALPRNQGKPSFFQ